MRNALAIYRDPINHVWSTINTPETHASAIIHLLEYAATSEGFCMKTRTFGAGEAPESARTGPSPISIGTDTGGVIGERLEVVIRENWPPRRNRMR